jgi:hypothetical protein
MDTNSLLTGSDPPAVTVVDINDPEDCPDFPDTEIRWVDFPRNG